jgi:hypothetical protein
MNGCTMLTDHTALHKPSPADIAAVQARTGMDYLQARAHLIGAAAVREQIERDRRAALARCLRADIEAQRGAA